MLSLEELSLEVAGRGGVPLRLLHGVEARFEAGTLAAVVGPSGCGKSTLLKVIAGILEPVEGRVKWGGRDLAKEGDFHPGEMGYVPQFSIAHGSLTVEENLLSALAWRCAEPTAEERRERAAALLQELRLDHVAKSPARLLSGGQRRRLALALERVSEPEILLCDEVTSGLDVRSELEIMRMLHVMAKQEGRLVISVTHSLRELELYDTVTVLYGGYVAYHGKPDGLLGYFGVQSLEDIFPALACEEAEVWSAKERAGRTHAVQEEPASDESVENEEVAEKADPHGFRRTMRSAPRGRVGQFFVLLARRFRLFFRDRAQIGLQLLLLLLFPGIVTLFAYDGLPQIHNLSMGSDVGIFQRLSETVAFTAQTSRVGSLVSGLIMFQVVLLALMASNNGAREIAAEREIFEKEKLAGLSPAAYLAATLVFLGLLVTVQSFWMTLFVKTVCGFEGGLLHQLGMLWMINAAVTAVSLALSSWAGTPERASLLAVYLVGFQLPLSGAVLALPSFIGPVVRPFIAAYWSWSGMLQTLRETRFYDVVDAITTTPISSLPLCYWVLAAHILLGSVLAYFGCRRAAWRVE